MSSTPMNVYFGGKKAAIPTHGGGSASIDLSNYATKNDLAAFNENVVDNVIEALHNMAEAEDIDFVKIYNDTRTDDDESESA